MPTRAKPKLSALVDARAISEELQVRPNVARGIFRAVAREYGTVRLPGLRRIFVRREDFERYLQSSGALRWV